MHLGQSKIDDTPDLRCGYAGEDVVYAPDFLAPREADQMFETLRAGIAWQEESIDLFGRRLRVPRMVSWAGDPGAAYRYSGVDHVAHGWPEELIGLREQIATALGGSFNFVLLNRYRTGADYMGWHSDDEAALGEHPVIASISLGAVRRFRMRRKVDGHTIEFLLEHGSLLVMRGECQRRWRHALARTRRPIGERINLTFRSIRDGAH